MKVYIATLMLLIGCTKTNQPSEISEVYYSISSEQKDGGGTYYSITIPYKEVSDSSDIALWSVSMNKIIYVDSGEESVVYVLDAKHADTRNFKPHVLLNDNRFYAYGFVNGIKTIMKNQIKPEHQEVRIENRPLYLATYGLYLSEKDLETLKKTDNLFIGVETNKQSEDGFPITLEVEVKPPVLDTLRLMAMDDWKNQLKRVQNKTD